MMDLLDQYQSLLQQQFPGWQMLRKDCATASITPPSGAGVVEIDVMVHRNLPGGLSAWRYELGRAIADDERLHGWVTIRDAQRRIEHHEMLCDSARLGQLLSDWQAAPAVLPSQLCLADADAIGITLPMRQKNDAPAVEPVITVILDETLLRGLPNLQGLTEGSEALSQWQADMAQLQAQRLLQSWPRDARGRLAARTSVVLAAYGPATRQRQPCLLLSSLTATQMHTSTPSWELHLSNEFLYNHRYQWSEARWLWTDELAPVADVDQAKAQALIAQGRISEACALYGVQLSRSVRLLAAQLPFQRFQVLPAAWPQELSAALRQLAPWRLAGGCQCIQGYLGQTNRKPPKPGSWERKLFWFSGQRQQVRYGLGIRIGAEGAPELDIIATASNEHFPEPYWKQAPNF